MVLQVQLRFCMTSFISLCHPIGCPMPGQPVPGRVTVKPSDGNSHSTKSDKQLLSNHILHKCKIVHCATIV